ncbi:hypothetical protein NKH77_51290 [Streptomyces sp. M19]
MSVHCHERQGSVSHGNLFLQKYVSAKYAARVPRFRGRIPLRADDDIASVLPTRAVPVPRSMQQCRSDLLFPVRTGTPQHPGHRAGGDTVVLGETLADVALAHHETHSGHGHNQHDVRRGDPLVFRLPGVVPLLVPEPRQRIMASAC